jgi:hypothetical protein
MAAMCSAIVDDAPHYFYRSGGTSLSIPHRIDSPHRNLVPNHESQREKLLASLRGQTVHIPDLKPLFQYWPTATSPHLQRIQDDVCGYLNG